MYEGDRNRAFANARRDSLDRTMSHIADYKDTRHVGFQEPWISVRLPSFRPLPITHQVRAGKNKPALITFDDIPKPFGVWRSTNHDEQRVGWYSVDLVAYRTVDGNCFETILSMRLDHR